MTPRRLLLPILLAALLASGCVGWPVQEMSNARQAITAAKKAGAAQYAPDALAEAERLLASAKSNAYDGEFRTAREEADQSLEKAIEARRTAEQAVADKAAADPEPKKQP
jgi:hypothetical protein